MTITLEEMDEERRRLGTKTRPWNNVIELVNTYYDIQKTRIAIGNRLKWTDNPVIDRVHTALNPTTGLEGQIKKEIIQQVKLHPLWPRIEKCKGMGPVLFAELLHAIIGQVHTAECLKKREKYYQKKQKEEKKKKREARAIHVRLPMVRNRTVQISLKHTQIRRTRTRPEETERSQKRLEPEPEKSRTRTHRTITRQTQPGIQKDIPRIHRRGQEEKPEPDTSTPEKQRTEKDSQTLPLAPTPEMVRGKRTQTTRAIPPDKGTQNNTTTVVKPRTRAINKVKTHWENASH